MPRRKTFTETNVLLLMPPKRFHHQWSSALSITVTMETKDASFFFVECFSQSEPGVFDIVTVTWCRGQVQNK